MYCHWKSAFFRNASTVYVEARNVRWEVETWTINGGEKCGHIFLGCGEFSRLKAIGHGRAQTSFLAKPLSDVTGRK